MDEDQRVMLRPVQAEDAETVASFLAAPHVARWWTGGTEDGLLALHEERPVGLAQWHRWDDRAQERDALGIPGGTVGLAVLIGHAHDCERGLGTELVATLLERLPSTPVWAAPAEGNEPGRRVLENNGFELMAVKTVAAAPVALYALQQQPGDDDDQHDRHLDDDCHEVGA